MKKVFPPIALALIFCSLSLSRAEVSLKEIHWGFWRGTKDRHAPQYLQEPDRWIQPPAGKVLTMPRVVVTLVNRGPAPAEGVVLRYAISARIVSIKTPGGRGTWGVPIWVDRRRVPFLKPNQSLDIQLDPTGEMRLATSMKEMFRAGFWPDALNIQVMVEPRLGEDIAHKTSDRTLPVAWRAAGK